MLPGQTDVRAFSRGREIEAVLSPYFEGVNGIDAVLMPYFSFFGSHSRESAFIFSALSAVFTPTRTLVKV